MNQNNTRFLFSLLMKKSVELIDLFSEEIDVYHYKYLGLVEKTYPSEEIDVYHYKYIEIV